MSVVNLVRALSRTEKDDLEDGHLTYDQISPLDRAKTLSHEVNILYKYSFQSKVNRKYVRL